MVNPIPTYEQPYNHFIPGTGITIDIDSGLEDEGNNEITITATGAGVAFTVGGVLKTPTAADDVLIWTAPFACSLTAVKAWQDTGTGSVINAFRGSLASPTTFLTANYTLLAADTTEDGGATQNTTVASDTKVYIRLVSVSGSPNEVGIQLHLTRS